MQGDVVSMALVLIVELGFFFVLLFFCLVVLNHICMSLELWLFVWVFPPPYFTTL